jgi:hypothetical protein
MCPGNLSVLLEGVQPKMKELRPSDITLPVGVESWDELQVLVGKLPGWVFRGQTDPCWRLQPSLEYRLEKLGSPLSWAEAESRFLAELPYRLSHLLPDPPPREDAMAWLALMQHYGGATRLLDLTYSLPVAVFFALEGAEDTGYSVVWAINDIIVRKRLEQILCDARGVPIPCRDGLEAGDLLNLTLGAEFRGPAAAAGIPRTLTQRQRIQKGLFLFALNPILTLEQNLFGMFRITPESVYPKNLVGWLVNTLSEGVIKKLRRRPIVKIFINNRIRAGLLQKLAELGVSRPLLFPDKEPHSPEIENALRQMVSDVLDSYIG